MNIPSTKYSAGNKDSIICELVEENKSLHGSGDSVLVQQVVNREFGDLLVTLGNIQQNNGFCTGLMYLSLYQFEDETTAKFSEEIVSNLSVISRIAAGISKKIG